MWNLQDNFSNLEDLQRFAAWRRRDFETQNYQQTMKLNRSTKPDLNTSAPLLGRCCYRFVLHCQTNKF